VGQVAGAGQEAAAVVAAEVVALRDERAAAAGAQIGLQAGAGNDCVAQMNGGLARPSPGAVTVELVSVGIFADCGVQQHDDRIGIAISSVNDAVVSVTADGGVV